MFNQNQLLRIPCILVVGLLLLSAAQTKSQMTTEPNSVLQASPIESNSVLQASPIELKVRPLPALQNLSHYQRLTERLDLEKTGEVITIMVLEILNRLEMPAWTQLGDLVCLTGPTRFFPVVYLQQETVTAIPTYQLSDWRNTVQINPKQKITLYLGFILKPGENAIFENSLKVYALFRHAEIQNVHYSMSISRRDDNPEEAQPQAPPEKPEQNGGGSYPEPPPPPPPPTFNISPQVNPIVARELPAPTTTISPAGAPYLDSLLGDLGKETQFPFWIGVAQSIEDGFDYYTAVQFVDEVADFHEKHENDENKLLRTTIWLKKPRILFAAMKDLSWMATSVYGVITVRNEAAEVLLFVASKALSIGIDQTHVAPIPGTYEEIIKTNPGEVIGFQIECLGVNIKAEKIGNDYQIEVSKKEQQDKPLKILNYHRKFS